jgi:hypothetical protein
VFGISYVPDRDSAVNGPSRANFDPARLVTGALIAVALTLELVALASWVMA